MITDSFRILAIVLLFIVILIRDIPFAKLLKSATVQLYLAVFVMTILLLFDNITGFLLTVTLLVVYFKIYNDELKNKKQPKEETNDKSPDKSERQVSKCPLDKPCKLDEHTKNVKLEQVKEDATSKVHVSKKFTQVPFTSEENLLAAQNNIVNIDCYNNEIFGVNAENVYGSQGLDNKKMHIRGYDSYNSVLGSLNYDMIS